MHFLGNVALFLHKAISIAPAFFPCPWRFKTCIASPSSMLITIFTSDAPCWHLIISEGGAIFNDHRGSIFSVDLQPPEGDVRTLEILIFSKHICYHAVSEQGAFGKKLTRGLKLRVTSQSLGQMRLWRPPHPQEPPDRSMSAWGFQNSARLITMASAIAGPSRLIFPPWAGPREDGS